MLGIEWGQRVMRGENTRLATFFRLGRGRAWEEYVTTCIIVTSGKGFLHFIILYCSMVAQEMLVWDTFRWAQIIPSTSNLRRRHVCKNNSSKTSSWKITKAFFRAAHKRGLWEIYNEPSSWPLRCSPLTCSHTASHRRRGCSDNLD